MTTTPGRTILAFFGGRTDDDDDQADGFAAITDTPHVESIYPAGDEAAAPVDADLPPMNPAPAPIFIRPRKASGWSTWRVNLAAGEPRQIAGQHLGRTSLIVRNTSPAQEVTVGPDDGVSAGVHFPIGAGGQLTADHTGEVWAIAAAAATLVMLAEYDNEKGGA